MRGTSGRGRVQDDISSQRVAIPKFVPPLRLLAVRLDYLLIVLREPSDHRAPTVPILFQQQK